MNKTNKHFVDQEIKSRHGKGIDHGADAKILVRTPAGILVWRKGHSYGSGLGQRNYSESGLMFYSTEKNRHGIRNDMMGTTLHRGGRLSKAVIEAHIGKIRNLLDAPDLRADEVAMNMTLVVERKMPQVVTDKQIQGDKRRQADRIDHLEKGDRHKFCAYMRRLCKVGLAAAENLVVFLKQLKSEIPPTGLTAGGKDLQLEPDTLIALVRSLEKLDFEEFVNEADDQHPVHDDDMCEIDEAGLLENQREKWLRAFFS